MNEDTATFSQTKNGKFVAIRIGGSPFMEKTFLVEDGSPFELIFHLMKAVRKEYENELLCGHAKYKQLKKPK